MDADGRQQLREHDVDIATHLLRRGLILFDGKSAARALCDQQRLHL